MSVDTVTGPHAWVRGPTFRSAPAAPAHVVSCVGAHGGAGTSTLAKALGGADLGCRWPEPGFGHPGQVLLVARTHAAGLQAVSAALKSVVDGERPVRLLAVALVADAPGRLPWQLWQRVRVLRSAVTVHRIPWVASWRMGREPDALPKELQELAHIAGITALKEDP